MERPFNLVTYFGEMCESTKWCAIESAAGTSCPEGTYSDARGLQAEAECHDCPEGKFCETVGMNFAALVDCPTTFYCPLGTDDIPTTGI